VTFGDRQDLANLTNYLCDCMPKKVKKPAKMSNTKALEDMVQMLLEECKTHEWEIAAEREHCQAEKTVQVQMQQMQDHMQALMERATSKEKALLV